MTPGPGYDPWLSGKADGEAELEGRADGKADGKAELFWSPIAITPLL
jgi:hypothetical protein